MRLLFDPASTDGGGTAPTPAKEPEKAATPPPAADPSEGFKAALAKHSGDALAFAREAYAASSAATAKLAEVQAKLPGKGAVVLAGDDAEAWQAYQALGKPDALKSTVEEAGVLKNQVAARARRDLIGEAAKAHGYDADVLAELPGIDGLKIEIRDGSRNGKPAKVAHVIETVKDGDKDVLKEATLDKWIAAHKPKFLPSLAADQGQPKGGPARQIPVPAANPETARDRAARQRPLASW
ncbi:MAG: hypothetical protein ABI353_11470 [Isosphaeraceae bacterium]